MSRLKLMRLVYKPALQLSDALWRLQQRIRKHMFSVMARHTLAVTDLRSGKRSVYRDG